MGEGIMRGPDFSKFDPQNSPPNVSIASGCIITIAISISAAFITLGARLYCRLVRTKKPGWDDATIVLATICIFIETIFKCIFIYHGQGRHVFYLDAHQIQEAYKYSQLAFFPFLFGTAIAKISIAFMVLRFTPAKGMRYFMYGLMASLVVSNGACVVILFSFCRPYYSLWDCKVKNAVCWSGRVLGIASSIQGVFSINTDLICTSLPLFIVWKLHMGLDQKLAVTILIDFGLITTGFCIARCIYYSKTKFAADQTWTGVDLVLWTSLESNFGIFAANLPALGFVLDLRKIIRRLKWFSSPISTPRFLQNFRIKETSGSDGETSKKEARKSNRWTLLKINIERGTFTGGWTEWSKELDELEGRD